MKKGYVYFINDGIGHMKIGVSDDPDRRIKELQTGNANKLELYYLLCVDSMDEAYEVEAILHNNFAADHMYGEWFREKNVISFINSPWMEIGDYRFKGKGIGIGKGALIGIVIGLILAILDSAIKLLMR